MKRNGMSRGLQCTHAVLLALCLLLEGCAGMPLGRVACYVGITAGAVVGALLVPLAPVDLLAPACEAVPVTAPIEKKEDTP